MNKVIIVILIILCVILSSFFSGIEIALAKVNKVRLERAVTKNEKGAKLANYFVNNYNDTITTILIGNNLVNITATSLATILLIQTFPNNAETLAAIIMTLVILVFGEIIPKSLATSYAFNFSKLFSFPLKFFQIIFYPITFIVQISLKGFNKLLSKKKKKVQVTDDELIEMVDTLEEQGLINEDIQTLITNAIDFIDVDAVEIMKHRTDVYAFDIDDDINALLNDPKLLNYSRIPVFKDNIDNIVGILNTKQIIKQHLNGDSIDINNLLTEPLYVFQTQSISEILKQMRQYHIHMAIVKDEYGGTLGILTMEDIIEELVGDIYDEKDKEENEEYHKVNQKTFTVAGDMNIYDFFDTIEYDYENYDNIYTTVGGWVIDQLGHFPKEKESFTFGHYRIKIISATQFTIERVSITNLEPTENDKENDNE